MKLSKPFWKIFQMKSHPYDKPIEIYRGFPIYRRKSGGKYGYVFEIRHPFHISGRDIKDIKAAINHHLKSVAKQQNDYCIKCNMVWYNCLCKHEDL